METTPRFEFVEAVPANGYVIHAIRRAAVHPDRRYSFGRALCGVSGRDSWANGGMRPIRPEAGALNVFDARDPNPQGTTDWEDRQMNEWCPRCIRLVAKATGGSA